MSPLAHPDTSPSLSATGPVHTHAHATASRTALWLTGLTLAWKLVECSISGYAAVTAHSPAILAFGADSVVELISAFVVLSQWSSGRLGKPIPERRAARFSAVLLLILALIVVAETVTSLLLHIKPESSRSGIVITAASLVAMPVFAHWKRREARRLHNGALAADAIQSATCAYLALLALLGLSLNAAFGIAWFDDLAALLILPVLLKEARLAWHGHFCASC